MIDKPVMLIAGGSGSIGSATARVALAQGWAVALHGKTPAKLAALETELGALGAIKGIEGDVFAPDGATSLVADVAKRFGRIDAVVDCVAAGVPGITGLFPDTDPSAFTPFYDVSAGWLLRLSHAAYPHLKVRGGTIISFVADAGIFAAPHQTGTGPMRAACIGFIRNLSREAGRDKIRAHVVSVSYVEGSDIVARLGPKRMETARRRAGLGLPASEDIAPTVVFLCSDQAAKMTGQVISINGAQRMSELVDDLAQRLLPLEGGVNFRDMGGYPAAQGKRVKWGQLFRSGTMARLTDADRVHLDERGFRTVIDFRTESEHAHEPNDWGMTLGEGYWRRPHDETFGNWSDLDPARLGTERDAERVLEAGFRKLPEQQAVAYAEMFRRLAAGNLPAVIHCTAGKDRTGGGAALILSVLGVPREHIVADFLLTQRAFNPQSTLRPNGKPNPDPKYRRFAEMKREVLAVFSSARPSFIAAFLDSLDEKHGGIDGYADALGITAADREEIRGTLLE